MRFVSIICLLLLAACSPSKPAAVDSIIQCKSIANLPSHSKEAILIPADYRAMDSVGNSMACECNEMIICGGANYCIVFECPDGSTDRLLSSDGTWLDMTGNIMDISDE